MKTTSTTGLVLIKLSTVTSYDHHSHLPGVYLPGLHRLKFSQPIFSFLRLYCYEQRNVIVLVTCPTSELGRPAKTGNLSVNLRNSRRLLTWLRTHCSTANSILVFFLTKPQNESDALSIPSISPVATQYLLSQHSTRTSATTSSQLIFEEAVLSPDLVDTRREPRGAEILPLFSPSLSSSHLN